MAGRGRPEKYPDGESLSRAVDAYFASISYQEPVVVATPTGEVTEQGEIKWTRRMLTQPGEAPGVPGKPVLETKWLRPPGLAGLCLYLGISRDTWARYGKKADRKEIVERARLRMEDYWGGRLDGKGANGARFALQNNFGWDGAWRERREVSLDQETRKAMSVEQVLRRESKEDGGDYEY